jgi:hypothetical protein
VNWHASRRDIPDWRISEETTLEPKKANVNNPVNLRLVEISHLQIDRAYSRRTTPERTTT